MTRLIETYHFGEYAAALQQFVWNELADVYIELSKDSLRDEARADAATRTLAYVLDRVVRLAHPLMPFISETLALQLWRALPTADRAPSLVIAKWPEPKQREQTIEDRFDVLIDVVRAVRNLRQSLGVPQGRRAKVMLAGDTRAIRELVGAIAHLTGSEVAFGGGSGTATVVRAVEVRVEAEHDAAEHRTRLERELAEAREVLQRSRDLLAKPGFAEKAPPSVVANEHARLAEREERVRLLEAELKRLK
jgi:valyl-tRNA synthetase